MWHISQWWHSCAKYGMTIVSGSWRYMTHCLMVINPCAKYGITMSKWKNQSRAKYESTQTNGRRNGQTDKRMEKVITIYPLNFIPHGRYKNPFLFQWISAFPINESVWTHGTIVFTKYKRNSADVHKPLSY